MWDPGPQLRLRVQQRGWEAPGRTGPITAPAPEAAGGKSDGAVAAGVAASPAAGPPIPARSRSHPLYGALHSSGGRCGPENEEVAAQGRVLPGPTDLGAEAGDRGRDGAWRGAREGGREIRRNVSYQRQLSMSVIKCRLGSKPLSVSRFRFQMQRLGMEALR